MNVDQRIALQESIEHWRENVARHARGEEMEVGREHCACCAYSDALCGEECGGCPIAQYTGTDNCYRTPYYEVIHGRAPPTEMLDWFVELEAGGNPPLLFNEPYNQ